MKNPKAKTDTKKNDNKLAVKAKASKARAPAKKEKAVKDPNKPKRPPSAFFVFMEDFRKEYKESHPENKSVANVGKAGGERWKSLTDAEKAPFVAKAEKRKTEYEKTMVAYNKKLAGGPDAEDEESDKSKSEVHDDEEGSEDGSDGDEDDD